MSLRIIKAGVLDTIQDCGRYGHQHLGINPSGAMDHFSAQLAHALLGNDLNDPVIEMHYHAPHIQFEKETIISLAGADFSPTLNGSPIPMHHPVAVGKSAQLKFERLKNGARTYLAIKQPLQVTKWLESFSTNIKACAGGWHGRALRKNDVLHFAKEPHLENVLKEKEFLILPWKSQEAVDWRTEISFLIGSEWHWMTEESKEAFQTQWFQLSMDVDRMGYKLSGAVLEQSEHEELVSSAVSFGTVQLLPNGQLIVLMADHQTTGGYPRVAHIISAHLPLLAQKKANDVLQFRLTSLEEAEDKMMLQQKYLQSLQMASKFRMEEYLHAV